MDISLHQGLFSILLLHTCLSQVIDTAETPLVSESILPPTEAVAQGMGVTELTLSVPNQEMAQEVVQEVSQEVAAETAEGATVEVAAPEATAPQEPLNIEQEVEPRQELDQDITTEVTENAATTGELEEPAPEGTTPVVMEEVGEQAMVAPAAAEEPVAVSEPTPAGPVQEESASEVTAQEIPAQEGAPEEVGEEVVQEATVEEGVVAGGAVMVEETTEEVAVDGDETGASLATETEVPDSTAGPADTYVPAESQGPAIPADPAETSDVGGEITSESNDFNEIITPTDELQNLAPVEAVPTPEIVIEEEGEEDDGVVVVVEEDVIPVTPSLPLLEAELGEEEESAETTAEEGTALGLEAWKIGAISAAAFLFVETIVIIVYVLKCRKKTASGAGPVKPAEDCEAAEIISEEVGASSPAAEEEQTLQNNIAESLDMSQLQQEETMADIPLDPPGESSPEDPAEDVCTSVL